MDADEAMKLLRAGAEGVRAWNGIRSTGGAIARLSGAVLASAQLSGADLSSVELTGADLQGADLGRANLSGAKLAGADLRRAVLKDANLNGATLGDADLTGAELRGASFEGVDLRAARGLTQAQIDHAGGDTSTQLPDPMVAPGRWSYAKHNPYSVF